MFLRRNRRSHKGETYEYWSLMRTVRTAKGPRHELVANLGKAPGLDEEVRRGWEEVVDLLEGRETAPVQGRLGKPLPSVRARQWTEVDVRGLRVERVRDFGEVYLALALWRRLGLHTLLRELIEPGRERVDWELVACILTVARFCGNKSELEVAERWYADSALEDLLGVPVGTQINDAGSTADSTCSTPTKTPSASHLMERYQSWFGVEFEFLLYDVTSTYFEGKAEGNPEGQARLLAATSGRIASRSTSVWWSRPRACPSATKSSTATAPT